MERHVKLVTKLSVPHALRILQLAHLSVILIVLRATLQVFAFLVLQESI